MAKTISGAKIITIFSQKGGSGKTTLTVNLAAWFASKYKTAIIDADPQASCLAWRGQRTRDEPVIHRADGASLATVVKLARKSGAQIILIDTPPHASVSSEVRKAVKMSDLALIPCRASLFDIKSIESSVDLVRKAGRKAGILLNGVPVLGPMGAAAREAVSAYQIPVCPAVLSHRACYSNAAVLGLGVTEHQPHSKASGEIRKLGAWVEKQL